MYSYEFFLSSSLEKVFPSPRPRPIENTTIPVFPGAIPAVQLVYTRHRGPQAARFVTPFAILIDGAPVTPVLRSVELIPADFPAYERADGGYITTSPCMFPDLLKPLDGSRIYPQPDQYRAVWIDFPGITKANAGTYTVNITVRADDAVTFGNGSAGVDPEATGYRQELSLTLEVLAQVAPPQTLLHTQWFHTDCLASYYHVEALSEAHWNLIENFMAPMVSRYGINTVLTPVFTPPLDTAVGSERPTVQLVDITVSDTGAYTFGFEKLERWCALCKKHGITHLEIAHFFSQWGAKLTPKIVARENGAERKQSYRKIFGWDVPATSPTYRRFLEQFIPALRRVLEENGFDRAHTIFHVSDEPQKEQLEDYRAAKALIADLTEGSLIIDALSDFSFYKEGVVEHPVPANDHIAPFIAAKVPGLWVYYCCGQCYEVPNRFFALPSARNRAMGVLMYLYRIEGFLQWGYNFYYSAQSRVLIDPFLNTGGLRDWPAGDPFIVYPGPDGKPLSSIRGEVHREALEDMRVLALVEEKAGRETAERIVSEDFSGQMTFHHYPLESGYYLKLREKAAKVLTGF
jgi:hypothetical protein